MLWASFSFVGPNTIALSSNAKSRGRRGIGLMIVAILLLVQICKKCNRTIASTTVQKESNDRLHQKGERTEYESSENKIHSVSRRMVLWLLTMWKMAGSLPGCINSVRRERISQGTQFASRVRWCSTDQIQGRTSPHIRDKFKRRERRRRRITISIGQHK